ncbi:MAG: polyhydroxyalkanoate synthesis repressor PhaR [Rickettsiales bacterium]|jgi:polyhydroxyalkanoate synthesis repressor PhaR|nr:polyhydroxyalkanoate synthesis repressor PhaR [Rickettsiales bacterium]
MAHKQTEIVIIKKYPNRRLYNTQTSSYITLDDLREMIRREEEFEVQDAKTGKNLTHSVLAQIIFDQESKGSSLLPTTFLLQLVRFYDDNVQSLLPNYLETTMQYFIHNQEQLQKFTKTPFQTPFPSPLQGVPGFDKVLEGIAKQNMALFEQTMEMFAPKTKK